MPRPFVRIPEGARMLARDRAYAQAVADTLNGLGPDEERFGRSDKFNDTNGVVRQRWIDYVNSRGSGMRLERVEVEEVVS